MKLTSALMILSLLGQQTSFAGHSKDKKTDIFDGLIDEKSSPKEKKSSRTKRPSKKHVSRVMGQNPDQVLLEGEQHNLQERIQLFSEIKDDKERAEAFISEVDERLKKNKFRVEVPLTNYEDAPDEVPLRPNQNSYDHLRELYPQGFSYFLAEEDEGADDPTKALNNYFSDIPWDSTRSYTNIEELQKLFNDEDQNKPYHTVKSKKLGFYAAQVFTLGLAHPISKQASIKDIPDIKSHFRVVTDGVKPKMFIGKPHKKAMYKKWVKEFTYTDRKGNEKTVKTNGLFEYDNEEYNKFTIEGFTFIHVQENQLGIAKLTIDKDYKDKNGKVVKQGKQDDIVLFAQGWHLLPEHVYNNIQISDITNPDYETKGGIIDMGNLAKIVNVRPHQIGAAYNRKTNQYSLIRSGTPVILDNKEWTHVEVKNRDEHKVFTLSGHFQFVSVSSGEIASFATHDGEYLLVDKPGVYRLSKTHWNLDKTQIIDEELGTQLYGPKHSHVKSEIIGAPGEDVAKLPASKLTNYAKKISMEGFYIVSLPTGHVAEITHRTTGKVRTLVDNTTTQHKKFYIRKRDWKDLFVTRISDDHEIDCGSKIMLRLKADHLAGAYNKDTGEFEEFTFKDNQKKGNIVRLLPKSKYDNVVQVPRNSDELHYFGDDWLITINSGLVGIIQNSKTGQIEVLEEAGHLRRARNEYIFLGTLPNTTQEFTRSVDFKTKDRFDLNVHMTFYYKIKDMAAAAKKIRAFSEQSQTHSFGQEDYISSDSGKSKKGKKIKKAHYEQQERIAENFQFDRTVSRLVFNADQVSDEELILHRLSNFIEEKNLIVNLEEESDTEEANSEEYLIQRRREIENSIMERLNHYSADANEGIEFTKVKINGNFTLTDKKQKARIDEMAQARLTLKMEKRKQDAAIRDAEIQKQTAIKTQEVEKEKKLNEQKMNFEQEQDKLQKERDLVQQQREIELAQRQLEQEKLEFEHKMAIERLKAEKAQADLEAQKIRTLNEAKDTTSTAVLLGQYLEYQKSVEEMKQKTARAYAESLKHMQENGNSDTALMMLLQMQGKGGMMPGKTDGQGNPNATSVNQGANFQDFFSVLNTLNSFKLQKGQIKLQEQLQGQLESDKQ